MIRSRAQHYFERAALQISSPTHLFIWLASLVPLVLVVYDVIAKGVNVPFLDQWDASYKIANHTIHGSLSFADLLEFHNEHRIFFTNLTTAISTRLFQWNLKLELFVTIALAIALLLLIVNLIRRDFPEITLVVIVPISVLIFSFRGQETWLTSFQSCFLWVTFFLLLAVVVLRRGAVGWRALILAALCALCATYSLGSGEIVWPLLLVGLLLFGYRKPAYFAFWLIAAAASIYFFYHSAPPQGLAGLSLSSVKTILHYALIYLGGVLIPNGGVSPDYAVAFTIISIALFIVNLGCLWWVKRSSKPLAAWILIGGYAAGTALVTGVGRRELFLVSSTQALEERYTIIAVFWWISLIVLGAVVIYSANRAAIHRRLFRLVGMVDILAFVVAIPLALYATGFQVFNSNIVNPVAQNCVEQYALVHDAKMRCLTDLAISVKPEWVAEIDQMQSDHLALFSTPQLDVPLAGLPFQTLQAGSVKPQYQYYTDVIPALASLSVYAPGRVEYVLHPPAEYRHIQFTAQVYLDPKNLDKYPNIPEDGAIFSATATDENGAVLQSESVLFDPHLSKAPEPFQFDLSAYAGQTVRLDLQTDGRQGFSYDQSMWVLPTIELSR